MKRALIAAAIALFPLSTSAADMADIVAAIERDDPNLVAQFIAEGGDIDAVATDGQFGGSPLLQLAARVNATRSAVLLIDAGARLNAASRTSGATALHAATLRGNAELVERLITAGADPNVLSHFGEVPLHNAIIFGQFEAVKILLDNGADPDRSLSEQGPAIMGTAHMAGPAVRRALGLSPAAGPVVPIIRELIAHGADINVADARGTTLLDQWMYRVCAEQDAMGAPIVDMLLDSGALLDQEKLRGFLDIGRTLGTAECDWLLPLTEQQQL